MKTTQTKAIKAINSIKFSITKDKIIVIINKNSKILSMKTSARMIILGMIAKVMEISNICLKDSNQFIMSTNYHRIKIHLIIITDFRRIFNKNLSLKGKTFASSSLITMCALIMIVNKDI